MKRVLIVEDNADWRNLLTMVIKAMGYRVITATTGTEAVRQAIKEVPHLILMDLGLPEMSGDDAILQIKANAQTRQIPIVVQSAFGSTPYAKRAMEAGAAEFMEKPISIANMQSVIRKYLPQ